MTSPPASPRMPPVATVGEWRRAAAAFLAGSGLESPAAEADLLIRHVLGLSREMLFTQNRRSLAPAAKRRLSRLLHKRRRHIPLQYLTGEVDFFGLTIRVNPSVLIPRPETEGLVERALALIPVEEPAWVLDVGTGSGCIAAAIASMRPRASIVATEASPSAARTAAGNLRRLGFAKRVRVLEGDLLEPVGNSREAEGFRVVVSNPPYIGERERRGLPTEVANHEPASALFAGDDGLAVMRRLIPQAAATLAPGGWLVLEIGERQGASVERLFAEAGVWRTPRLERDLAGRVRYAVAQRT